MEIYKKREHCASCNSTKLKNILDLGSVPLAGFFPKKEEIENVSSYPLKLQICEECKLVQTDSVIDPDVLFRDYRYLSSVGLSKYFEGVANELNERYDIKDKDILEFGCNDGVLLKPLTDLGAKAIGIDPSINVSQIARDRGLNVITNYFNYENFGTDEWKERFDIIISNNTFAHIIDITNTVKAVNHCLKAGGKFIFEVHYLKNLIEELQWDNIYHEHIYYYSVTALQNMLERYGMNIVDFEKRDIHSGSIRIIAEKSNSELSEKVKAIINEEKETICNLEYLEVFQNNVLDHIESFNDEIKKLKEDGLIIAGYGASGRANMFCNITNLNNDIIEFIVDESPERCGRYIANTDIPIVGIDVLKEKKIDVLIIFAWNYSKMIVEKTKFNDFTYMIAFPVIKYFNKSEITELEFKSI
jgi:SAM-dependent methyltransferase